MSCESTQTFTPSAFQRLKNAESNHFWFLTRRKWIFDRLKRFIPPPAKVLEVGCGTGNVSSFLALKGYTVIGCELYAKALKMAWQGFLKVQGDANLLPFKDSSFDAVGLFAIIEHFQNHVEPLRESLRIVRSGGFIVVTVPARQELWSNGDEKSFHKRRYSRSALRRIFLELNLTPLLIEYMFMSLYLPVKFTRSKRDKKDDKLKINRFVNNLLKGVFEMERAISKGISLPTGTSLIAIAQKK
jgi:ubiquinone/menaquinone biosynthesis C-methylase UbiE